MKSLRIAWVLAGMVGASAVAGAEQADVLLPGEYEVSIRLELPHVESMDHATKVVSVCVVPGDATIHGLVALNDDNPLRKCPASNVRHDGPTLTFDVVCPGSDAAVGAATYTLSPERFEGAIAVKMGGKNMTMIERQSGRRVGGCKSQPPRSS